MKHISKGCHCCFFLNAVILIIVSAISFSTSFWSVSFTSCNTIQDQYYYITLNDGLCVDLNSGVTSDWEDCTDWKDLEDVADDDLKHSASDYTDANKMCKVALALCAVNALLVLLNAVFKHTSLSVLQFGSLLVSALLFIGALTTATSTWYTDVDNYSFQQSNCSDNKSAASLGWGAAAMGVAFSVLGNCCSVYTLCCRASSDDSFPSVLSTSYNPSSLSRIALSSPSSSSRIVVATATMSKFLKAMMGSGDRCSIVAFNNEYKQLLLLGNEAEAISTLHACRSMCSGTTHLWDSIFVSVAQFVLTADGTRPWVLIILTDGDDVGSSSSLDEASTMLAKFNEHSTNFVFVIGLGNEVNGTALNRLCNQGRSFYMHANDAHALELLFPLIALQVVQGLQVDIAKIEAQGVEAVYAQVRETSHLQQRDVDFLLLVDISTSMNSV